MTSLMAWQAVDSRGPTGLYFASDSRVTYRDGSIYDHAAKLFTVSVGQNRSEIFAFAGDVDFAQPNLIKLCRAIEDGGVDPSIATSAYGRADWSFRFLQTELESINRDLYHHTTILHGSRNSWGPTANFVLHSYTCKKGSRELELKEETLDAENSSYRSFVCSGSERIVDEIVAETFVAGRHSRSFFTAFCDAVRSGSDKWSGGPVQLVGIGNKSEAQFYGIVLAEVAYYQGKPFEGLDAGIFWFNGRFERVDRSGNLLKDAQRHDTARHRG